MVWRHGANKREKNAPTQPCDESKGMGKRLLGIVKERAKAGNLKTLAGCSRSAARKGTRWSGGKDEALGPFQRKRSTLSNINSWWGGRVGMSVDLNFVRGTDSPKIDMHEGGRGGGPGKVPRRLTNLNRTGRSARSSRRTQTPANRLKKEV